MCAPAISAVAGIGMAALQAGASYQAQQADYAAKMQQWRQNIVNAEAAGRDDEKQIIGQQLIQQDKLTQARHISFIQQAQKSAAVEVNAADSGVAGISVNNLLRDIAGKSELNRTYEEENYRNVVADTQQKLMASTDKEESEINSITPPVPPSPLPGFATVAGAGIKAFGALSNSSGGGLSDLGISLGDG